MVEVADQLVRQTVRFIQIFDHDAIAVVRAEPHSDDQIATVFGDAQLEAPVRLIGTFVNQHIGRLLRANSMIVHLHVGVQRCEGGSFFRPGITSVEESFAVRSPFGSAEFDPLQFIVQQLAGFDLHDLPGVPVGARVLNTVCHVPTIVTEGRS